MIFTGLWLGIYWTSRVLLVLPALAVWRWVLTPVGRMLAVVGREIRDALGHAWRVAGRISLAVGRFLANLFRWIFVEPTRWVYRTALTPAGHFVRDVVWKPAGGGRAQCGPCHPAGPGHRPRVRPSGPRRLCGRRSSDESAEPEPVHRREPGAAGTRTLGRSKTALTKD